MSISEESNMDVLECFRQKAALSRLFFSQLRKTYWAEKKLLETVSAIAGTSSGALRDFLEMYQEQTHYHLRQLEEIFSLWGLAPRGERCYAMTALIVEIDDLISGRTIDSSLRDIGLILVSQKIDHYETAAYNALQQLVSDISFIRRKDTPKEREAVSKLLSIHHLSAGK